MERRRRRLAVLCAHLRPSQLSASLCTGGGGPAAAAAAEEEVSRDKGCVFCAIVRGESPAFKVYEDDVCLCILDSNPLSHGHSLIIPKCHFPSLEATPPPRVTNGYYLTWSFHHVFFFLPTVEVVAAMCSKVPFLSNAIMKAAQCDSFNLVVNNGSAAGQVIFHTHFHIIPRKAGDQLWPSESFRRQPLERNQETIGLVNSIKEHLCASPCSESRTEGSAVLKDL